VRCAFFEKRFFTNVKFFNKKLPTVLSEKGEMKMKKLLALIIALLMLCACAHEEPVVDEPEILEQEEILVQQDEEKTEEPKIPESNEPETPETEEPENEKPESNSGTTQSSGNGTDKSENKNTNQNSENTASQSGNSGGNKEKEQNSIKKPAGTSTSAGKLIPDEAEPFVTLFNNAAKTAAKSYIGDELRALLINKNIKSIKDSGEADNSSLGKALTIVDTIEFINKNDGKKYTLSLYEKGFVLSGSAAAKFNGASITVEKNVWNHFINKVETEFENADYVIPHWLGLISLKRVKEVIVFGENGEKYRFNKNDDAFDNFESIFKNDIRVDSLEERFGGNKITEKPSGDYIRVKVYFETGTVYEILAERDHITIVSSDMNYGLRYILAEKSDAYDAFLDYAEGGPINAVTGN